MSSPEILTGIDLDAIPISGEALILADEPTTQEQSANHDVQTGLGIIGVCAVIAYLGPVIYKKLFK